MDETKDKMNTRRKKKVLNPFAVNKIKKRSLVERELETNMTSRMTSPVSTGDRFSTSRYGRARRLVTENDNGKVSIETLKPSKSGNTPMKVHFQSPSSKLLVNKQETPKKAKESTIGNIDNVYLENKALSRFSDESKRKNPHSSSPKIYIRKDLIQNRDDDDDDVILIKDLFSPKSGKKQKLTQSSSKPSLGKKEQINNASVVKTLDFNSAKGSKRNCSGDKKTANTLNDTNKGSKRDSSGDKKTANTLNDSNKGSKRVSSGDKKTANTPNDSNKGSKRDSIGNQKATIKPNDSNEGSKRDSIGHQKTAIKLNDSNEGSKRDSIGNQKTVIKPNDSNKSSKRDSSGDNKTAVQSCTTKIGSPATKVNVNSIELSSPYQDGELAWARVGSFAFWPCLITRDPNTNIFVRKKLFGRVEHHILHVTFLADNGRRSWVVDNMLREYRGLEEFISTRKKFTIEDKKKDPRYYAAFYVSEKKQTLWNCAVEEAETINREPKNQRIDVFNEMLFESRAAKKEKSGRITRTDSDVSLSESLYDSLFSEDDSIDDSIRSRNRSRNKSLDVSDVVTACLDNMAAKTGNIKIQRQSHMDRWLQIAKSKTPEKVKINEAKTPVVTPKVEVVTPTENIPNPFADKIIPGKTVVMPKERPLHHKKKRLPPKEVKITKVYGLRRSYESQNSFIGEETDDKINEAKNNIDTIDTSKAAEESNGQKAPKKNADKNYRNLEVNNTTISVTLDKNTDNCNIIPKDEINIDENVEPLSKELATYGEVHNPTVMESESNYLMTRKDKHSSEETKAAVTITHKKNIEGIEPKIIDEFGCQVNIDQGKTNKTPVIEGPYQDIDSNDPTKNDTNNYVTNTVINNKKRKLPFEDLKARYSLRKSYESHNLITTVEPDNQSNGSKIDVSKVRLDDNTEKAIVDLKSSNCNRLSKDGTISYCFKEVTSSGMESQSSTQMDENNDALLNAIDELLGDAKDTDTYAKPFNEIAATKVTKPQEETEVLNTMDVDIQDCKVTNNIRTVIESQIIEGSQAKPKKYINEQENSGADRDSVKTSIDYVEKGINSDFSTEIGKTAEFIGVDVIASSRINLVSESNQGNAQKVIPNDVSVDASLQTSPTLKRNEMISIPDIFNMTDDDKTIESTEYSIETNRLDNNPYIGSESTRDVIDATDKTNKHISEDTTSTNLNHIPFDKLMSLEVPIISNEELNVVNEKKKPVSNTEKSDNISNEQNILIDPSLEGEEYNMTKNDILNESGHSESILEKDLLTIDPSLEGEEYNMTKKDILNESGHSESILDKNLLTIDPSLEGEEYNMTKKDILNESGHSESILDKDLLTKSGHYKQNLERDLSNESGLSETILKKDLLNEIDHSVSLRQIEINYEPGTIIDVDKVPERIHFMENRIPESILYNNNEINKVDSTIPDKNIFLDQVNLNKPPDFNSRNLAAKAKLLQNLQNHDNDYGEDSDDEPSPEYEPLGDEITEDFRQHMMCIESNITDKKDDAQLVKVCNEIAVLVKSTQTFIESHVESSSINSEDIIAQKNIGNCEINYECSEMGLPILTELTKAKLTDFKSPAKPSSSKSLAQMDVTLKNVNSYEICEEPTNIDLTHSINVTSGITTKTVEAEILEGLEIINKALENNVKSPLNKKRRLSLKKAKIFQNDPNKTDQLTIVNERYKTIDQIEEIMKNKPKRLPIENGEIQIPEIKENGYHFTGMDTPDHHDDDFDIEEASVNSEDSEVSLPQNNIPARRSLRSRPGKKGGLEDPEFLTYLELRQDNLMEEHPELSLDDIVLYLYKTYAYGQNINADVEIEEASVSKLKQETQTPSWAKSKKQQVQPKNTIKNYFHEKYKNAKKIDFVTGVCDDNEDIKLKRDDLSISPVDSGIGNSIDSNTSDTHMSRKTKTDLSQTVFSPVIMKDVKVELINDVNITKIGSKTPKKYRQKSPRVLSNSNIKKLLETQPDKRVPVVIISPMKDKLTDTYKHITETKHIELKPKTETESKSGVPVVIISPMKDKLTDTNKHKSDLNTHIELKPITATESASGVPVVVISPMKDKLIDTHKHKSELKHTIVNPKTETESTSGVPVVIISPMKDKLTVKYKHRSESKHIDLKPRTEKETNKQILECALKVNERKPKTVTESKKCERIEKHKRVSEAKIIEPKIETESPSELSPIKGRIERHIKRVTESKNIIIKPKTVTQSIKCESIEKHKRVSKEKTIEPNIETGATSELGVSKLKHGVIEKICTETNNIEYITDREPNYHKIIKQDQEPDAMDTKSMDSDSELPLRQLRTKVKQEKVQKKNISEFIDEIEGTASVRFDNKPLRIRPEKVDKNLQGSYEDPEFLKYQELKQDAIVDQNPQLTQNEITAYLYKTWIYETNIKSDIEKNDDIESCNLIRGVNQEHAPQKKIKRKPKVEKSIELNLNADEVIAKDKPKRSKTVSRYYNEEFLSDIEDELEVFEVFKTKKTPVTVVSKFDSPKKERVVKTESNEELAEVGEEINTLDEIELYFKQLTSPKPSVFKGLIRENVCEICEDINNLIKCNVCHGSFHYDCVNKVVEYVQPPAIVRGRKKKKKLGRKPKNLDDSETNEDSQHDISEENTSMEDMPENITIDADTIEAQIEAKMKELLDKEDAQIYYDSFSSDDGIDWSETLPGKCELIDYKLKPRSPPIDYANFKCNNCQKHNAPICFVCKSFVSKCSNETPQKCNVLHCNKYYHVECLDHWPQAQFNAGAEWIRSKNLPGTLTCPRHVCHTCVSDDPRGCKTRFCGDKLAKCVRCPATYHSFNKCLPAGTQILTASLVICPRHYEHSPGKVPCHVNTGWCFICALGGSLICCEYCPTSFHAECLNIKPPEGNYMCEDCETGRLPLYGEMVWVKLGHYRWWPGLILHPSEIPENIMAVKHGLGEFVVRFFGQYDHFWVNRGRVFPYQEGDSGRISGQKSKIDADFTTAIEHAQRAFKIRKNTEPNDEESQEILSSLLPPQYVKLKSNKPIGSLLGRKIEDPSLSLTQCECDPNDVEPCGANSQCLNRVLLTECGPTCRAGERCNNRAFEKRQYPKLTAYKAPHRGWGLKTLQDIKAGQFVIEYVGELIDEEEFQWRMRRKHEIRDENFYFLTLDKERMIDAGPKGNLARFMNHCCEPNCETQKWTVLGDVRVGLFAIRDIKKNSEVTFNYNLECSGIEKKRCLCGAKRCSGYIGAKPKQLDESQGKKNVLTKRKYTKRKNVEESTKTQTKLKRGRPPKPKEQTDKHKTLSEIEKDLLIINASVTENTETSGEKKTDSNPTGEVPISNNKESKKTMLDPLPTEQAIVDPSTTAEGTILSSTESTQSKQRRKSINILDSNTTEATIQNNTDSKETKKPMIKIESNTMQEGTISNSVGSSRVSYTVHREIRKCSSKIDPNTKQEAPISNSLSSRVLKRKLCSDPKEQVSLTGEPSAKSLKYDKPVEVGD